MLLLMAFIALIAALLTGFARGSIFTD